MRFLDTLEVGSKVAVTGRNDSIRIRTIVRMTKTQFVLDNDARFNRSSGSIVGGSIWDTAIIIDPESYGARLRIAKQRMRLAYQGLQESMAHMRDFPTDSAIADTRESFEAYQVTVRTVRQIEENH